jgi:hypothetical protein
MILYHGTNIDTDDLIAPLWVTPDYHLSGHFALHAKSGTIKTQYGYIYKLKVDDKFLKKMEKPIGGIVRRYTLEGGKIEILDKQKVVYDPITMFKKSN